MSIDVITGKWEEGSNSYALTWDVDNSSVEGFAIVKSNTKAKMYIDTNKNGKKDKRDKLVAKLKIADDAYDYNVGYGTWLADSDSRIGSFVNPDGVELVIARFKDLSAF